jgi:hypothetical protein
MLVGLTSVYHAQTAMAASAAMMIWLVSFYAVVPIGLWLAAHEGLSWRKLKLEARGSLRSSSQPQVRIEPKAVIEEEVA